MTTTKHLTIALALTAALGLGACAQEDDAPAGGAEETTSVAQEGADDTQADDTEADDATSDDAAGETAGGPVAAPAPVGEGVAAAMTAIATAETEAGGIAYEIDDQDDDGTWEVDVAVDDRSVEVTVSADGSTVEGTEEDDLDADDRAALDAASITLQEAIETAIGEVGGVLDDAELDEENGEYAWEVTVDGADSGDDDVEVRVAVTGEVLSTDA